MLHYLKIIDSTSTELRRRMANEELLHGYCISADFQTNGHGQATNYWESEDSKNFEALNHKSGMLFGLATENEDGSLNPKCLKSTCLFPLKEVRSVVPAL